MLMARRALATLVIALASRSALAAAPPQDGAPAAPAARLEPVVTVRLAPGVNVEDVVDRARAAGLPVRARGPGVLAFVDLSVESGDVAATAAALRQIPGIELAESNAAGAYEAVTPDDPLYADQWNLCNPGGFRATADADVDADEAWSITQGEPGVIIAVIDTGVDATHPDLQGRLWCNPGEVAAAHDGVDNDGNGFIDDVAGWNFALGSDDIRSVSGHGTEVAGVIGARGDNGLGIAGIAGGGATSAGCTLMVLCVGDPDPLSSLLDDAIVYAVRQGARVINISFTVPRTAACAAALDFAEARNVVVVCAAGNRLATVGFPACYGCAVPVASFGPTGELSSFSSPGAPLAQRGLAAPGEMIPTTGAGHGYAAVTGTSMAAPHVAAAVGLVLSRPAGAALTADGVRGLLRRTADPLDAGPGLVGAGRLNIAKALQALETSTTLSAPASAPRTP